MKCTRTISGRALFPKPHTPRLLLGIPPQSLAPASERVMPFRLDSSHQRVGTRHCTLLSLYPVSLSVDYLSISTAQYPRFLATLSTHAAIPSTQPPTRVTSQMQLSPAPKVLDPARLTPGILVDKSEHHRNRRRTWDWRKHSKTPGAICIVGFVKQVYNACLW